MRILIICIFFSSLISPSKNIKTVTQAFSISNNSTSLNIDLKGDVQVVYWDENYLLVETTINDFSSSASTYSVNYTIEKGNFELACHLTGSNTILLKSKRNNNTIFRKGHQQKTEQHFKIFIPNWLQYSIIK